MRIATWNVNSLPARLPRVLAWLAAHQPDVVLLQETKTSDSQFPHEPLRAAGYTAAHHGTGRWNGVAILARSRLSDVQTGQDIAYDGVVEPRLVGATADGVRFTSVYVPNGRSVGHPHLAYKLEWLKALRSTVSSQQDAVLGGDFNVAPTDSDVWDPRVFVGSTHVTKPERAAVAALVDDGFVDLAVAQHGPQAPHTYWDYRQGFFRRGFGMRIDLLLASPAVAGRCNEVWVDRAERKPDTTNPVKPSDHAPLVAELA